MALRKLVTTAAAFVNALVTAACSLATPLPESTTVDERLAMIPIKGLALAGPATIHWDAHQIPFIEAQSDTDGARVLGVAHAHLRLAQMEMLRRASQGRLAEMLGPFVTDIDRALRTMAFGRAAGEIERTLPPETRAWLSAFVEGINHYQANVKVLPVEFRMLGLKREAWTVRDVITIGRLASADVNWLVWINVLKLRVREDWPELWARLVENGSDSVPSFAQDGSAQVFANLLSHNSRSGSNSLAVGRLKAEGQGALIANDPHLGISMPNVWLIAGLKTPSYHAVGLMAPGLPFFAIGRNPRIAWGGTNMRAASSELYDVSALADDALTERREAIKVRWWFDDDAIVRDSEWGPVLSDIALLELDPNERLALRWMGHLPSDEITALLKVARARDFDGFRDAFRDFAVPAQNMLYADDEGNIGQVMAVRLPKRNGSPPSDVVLLPSEGEPAWQELIDSTSLPYAFNPAPGFLASANNRPTRSDIQVGYFFSPDDRVKRMVEILSGSGKIGVERLKDIQSDVYMESSAELAATFLREMDAFGIAHIQEGAAAELIAALAAWDGHYRTSSRGAVAFELFREAFTTHFYTYSFGEQDWAAFADVARVKTLMREDIEEAEPARLRASLEHALVRAAERFGEISNWGEMHRLGFSHMLALLPLVGERFRFADYPIGGSTDTLMKTAHGLTHARHTTSYGANARHISDLSDLDANYFVLLGGQDGWINSSTAMDQLPLWLAGDYIQVPLDMETVRAAFSRTTRFAP